jgi:glucosylceramidase
LISFILAARAINPGLRLHASPWSPPGWMKTTGTIDRGGRFIDTPDNRDAYAIYLRRFIETYRDKHGLDIARLCVQNEPDSVTAEPDEKMFPTCLMPPETMIRLVVDHLAPAFVEAGLSTEIWAGTFRTITGLQAHRCMEDERFARAIAGCAFQYALPEYLDEFVRAFPTVPIMHTESVCFNGDNTPIQAAALFEDFVRYVRAGCDVYTYWNMILDERQTSTWGWRQNSLFVIDRSSGQAQAQPDYHVMRLLSRNVPPGSQRIEAFCFVRPTIAVQRPDGTIAVFLWNDGPARSIEVMVDQMTHHVDVPGHALAAMIFRPPSEGVVDG